MKYNSKLSKFIFLIGMTMVFNEDQEMIFKTAYNLSKDFPLDYWMEKDLKNEFAAEFWDAITEHGFLGMVIPEEYGGAGYGLSELISGIEGLVRGGAGMAGVWYLMLTEIFLALPIVRYGTPEQKERYLPRIARGEVEGALALTEPDVGSNTLSIKTFARREGDGYVVSGRKVFISGIDRASSFILVARTKPIEEVDRKTYGLTLFIVDMPDKRVRYKPIPKHGINYSHSCEVYIDELYIPEENVLGPVDAGWYVLLDILNPERIGFAIGAVSIGYLALEYAVEYAKKRVVFGRPIGSYQAIQHGLARPYSFLEGAKLLAYRAASTYDSIPPPQNPKDFNDVVRRSDNLKAVGRESNIAKYVAVETGIEAVYWAMQAFGGYGYAREFHVERWWREINLLRLAPVTQQLALNYIARHVLGLPRG